MINIEKAQKIITDNVECTPLSAPITREGAYLGFEDLSINNIANVDYYFVLYVATAFFNKDKTKIYKELNKALNEINTSGESPVNPVMELEYCRPLEKNKNLMIYALRIKVNIIG